MLEITNIHKSFGEQIVLQGIDMSFEQGKIHTLVGGNGIGKTTFKYRFWREPNNRQKPVTVRQKAGHSVLTVELNRDSHDYLIILWNRFQ